MAISYGRIDNLGVKRRVLVGHVGVEKHSRFGTVTKIDLARLLSAATSPELLSVGGRSSAFAPMCRKGLAVLMVNQRGQGFAVGLVANVPSREPRQFGDMNSKPRRCISRASPTVSTRRHLQGASFFT